MWVWPQILEVTRGHIVVESRSLLHNNTQGCIFCMYTQIMISSTEDYESFISEVSWSDIEVKLRSHHINNTHGCNSSMDIRMTIRSIVGCVSLILVVIGGHSMSHWGQMRKLFNNTLGTMLSMYTHITHMTIESIIWWVSLTSGVIRGQWRSNWGHTLTATLRDEIICMYSHILVTWLHQYQRQLEL